MPDEDVTEMALGPGLFGRREILTGVSEITRENLPSVLREAISVHTANAREIDYLYRYSRGQQPIWNRHKSVRPEICNKVVENHANEIESFTAGYFLGEPITYVRRGNRSGGSDEISKLNDYMFFEDKETRDMELATWMARCGVGYRMILPDQYWQGEKDDAPFELDTPDPRHTFVVYSSGFGHREMMGVRRVFRQGKDEMDSHWVYCGYTRTHYFEAVEGAQVTRWEPHALEDIPIFEYILNTSRLGSFEPALPLTDESSRPP